jgi:hypothetical protein
MKRILGMTVAAAAVVLQVAGFAAWHAEPSIYLAPIEAPESIPEIVHQRV